MQDYRLQRTGEAPLAFSGELLSVDDKDDPKAQRKFRLALYRTESGRIVAEFVYTSVLTWNEPEVRDAEVFDVGPGLADELAAWFEEQAEIGADERHDGTALVKWREFEAHTGRKNRRQIEAVTAEFYRCLGVVLNLPMFEERV